MVGPRGPLSKLSVTTGHFVDFAGSPVVEHPPANAGDTGSIPGQGTKSHVP